MRERIRGPREQMQAAITPEQEKLRRKHKILVKMVLWNVRNNRKELKCKN